MCYNIPTNADGLKRESERVMKKTIKLALFVCLILLVSALMLTACNMDIPADNNQQTTPNNNEQTTPAETPVPHVHTIVIDAAIPPTCAETGLTEGKHCSVCGEVIKSQEYIKPFGHTEIIDKAVAPTCTEAGLAEGKHCSVCGDILVAQEIVKAPGHSEIIDEAVAATCTASGKTEGKHCDVCGEILVAQEIIPANGHASEVAAITPPTATQNGSTTYTCSVCSYTYTKAIVPTNFAVTKYNRAMVGYTGKTGENLVIPATFENNGTWYRVTTIGDSAFYGCTELTSITIPNSVTSISDSAFQLCSRLTNITFEGTVDQWNAIPLSIDWIFDIPATEVICSNGIINLIPPEFGKLIYTFNEVRLRQQATNTGTVLTTVPKETELLCIKQSDSWYYVEYKNGDQTLRGYVAKTSVTEENILGTDFVNIDGGSKIMYVTAETLNIRLYPSDNNNFSTKMGSYKLNDAVTVLATNGTWARIQYATGKIYYVVFAYLSDTEVEDPNDESKYADLFTDVDGTPTMYVDNVYQVKLRKAPNINADEILTLAKGAAVTILKTGSVESKEWKYVVVEIPPQKEGYGYSYVYGYISADCLSYNNGDMTVDQLIVHYPMFEKVDVITMYVVIDAAITIRSNPVYPEEGEDNSLSHPKSTAESIKSLKVLATGVIDETQWYIIEYVKKDGQTEKVITGFIANGAMKYLTADPNGKVTLTPDDILLRYPYQFEKFETPVTVTTNALANCYGTPEAAKEPLKQLAAGTQVTIVAQEKGNYVTWALIRDAEGAYYFVHFSLLKQAR